MEEVARELIVRPVSPEKAELSSDDPIEIVISRSQRYWVDQKSLLGLRVRGVSEAGDVLGIIYNQIEDASNPFGSVYSTMLTIEAMGETPGTEGWNFWVADLELNTLREDLAARVGELYEGLKSRQISFLGLDLEKFQSAMLIMMDRHKKAVEITRIPEGDNARGMFSSSMTAESERSEGRYFYYYPDGDMAPLSDKPLELLDEKIAALKQLPKEDFIAEMFGDLHASILDGGGDILASERYASPVNFARCIYQKFFAITYAIRVNLAEDSPILLGGGGIEPVTLREIKVEIAKARSLREMH